MTTATRAILNRDTVSGEALFILKNLRDNSKQGRSNKLAEVKTALEPAVSLEFDAYFFFLRKFHYIAMDREAQLKLTDSGERVVDGDTLDKFKKEVSDFFADQMTGDNPTTDAETKVPEVTNIARDLFPPPPVHSLSDLVLEEKEMAPPVPPP